MTCVKSTFKSKLCWEFSVLLRFNLFYSKSYFFPWNYIFISAITYMLSILDCGENSYIFICQSSKMNALFFFTKPFPKSTSYKLFRTQNSVCSMQLDFLQRTSQKYFNFIYREHNLLFQDKIIVKTSEKFNCDISKIYEKLNSKSKIFTYFSKFQFS